MARKIAKLGVLAGALTLAVASSVVQAATISFTSWTSNDSVEITPTFTVSDDVAGVFTVRVGLDPLNSLSTAAKITGIFFDLGVNGFASANVIGPHTHYATDTDRINGVTIINPLGDFDVVLGFKPQANPPVEFTVSTLDGLLTLDSWTRVGVRWQGYDCTGCEGSDKVVSSVRDVPNEPNEPEVPEPAPLSLLGLGLLALGMRRRKA